MEKKDDFVWGVLLHLGTNMWHDWNRDLVGIPSSLEEERKMYPDRKVGKHGILPELVRNYLRADDAVWHEETEAARREGLNLVIIDIGEGYAFPSRPELHVNGSWSPDKMRRELVRLRKMGLEPIPKLNFSTCHDQWLKEYHSRTSSRAYYEVVADVIRDVAEVFDRPRFFHLGFDEELPHGLRGRRQIVVRKGDLWWHDFFYAVGEVERHGARAVMWSDKICDDRAEFLRRMSKGVLQMNWYYRSDFSPKKLAWNTAFEKKGGWGETVNGAAAFMELEKAGFDQMPCTSNWAEDASAEAVVKYCKEHIDPARLKGFCTAPWAMTVPDTPEKTNISKVLFGIDLLSAARDRHYPKT